MNINIFDIIDEKTYEPMINAIIFEYICFDKWKAIKFDLMKKYLLKCKNRSVRYDMYDPRYYDFYKELVLFNNPLFDQYIDEYKYTPMLCLSIILIQTKMTNDQIITCIDKHLNNKDDILYLLKYQKLPEYIIEKIIDKKINNKMWRNICRYQNLSEEFIYKYKDKLDWFHIIKKRNISKQLREDLKDMIEKGLISNNRKKFKR